MAEPTIILISTILANVILLVIYNLKKKKGLCKTQTNEKIDYDIDKLNNERKKTPKRDKTPQKKRGKTPPKTPKIILTVQIPENSSSDIYSS